MTEPEVLLAHLKSAHERERVLFARLTEEQLRGPSLLHGWTRGHVLASRVAFMRAAGRQIDHALAGLTAEFYDDGRAGRDAEIEVHAGRPVAELVAEVRQERVILEEAWSRVGPADWARPVGYRDGTLTDVLLACWREPEIHRVDIGLGIGPSDWSPELCVHLFGFLEPRVPDGVRVELITPDGHSWTVGEGERVEVRGALTDLAAWMAGREPEGPVESPALPVLGRLRDARR